MNYSFECEISEIESRIRAGGGAAHPRTQRAREYLDLLVKANAAVRSVPCPARS